MIHNTLQMLPMLGLVLLLMVGGFLLWKKIMFKATGTLPFSNKKRVKILETNYIDNKSKLILLRYDDKEFMVFAHQNYGLIVQGGSVETPS